MTSVRWWPHTDDPRVASYRLRCRQIVDALRAQGVDAGLFEPSSTIAPQVLVLSKRYDAATLQTAMAMRQSAGTRVLLDLCDNHLHVHNAEARLLERADALRQALRMVDRVVVSSSALAEVVGAEGVPGLDVTVVPDASEPAFEPTGTDRLKDIAGEWDRQRLALALLRSGAPRARRLLWFGNHGSPGAEGGMSDLLRIQGLLQASHAVAPLSLTVISNDAGKFARLIGPWRLPVHYLRWRASTFSRAARLHGTALVPVSPNPFTRCKTNNRVATAFVHGLNVVADSIPSYAEFAQCAVLDDWPRGLGLYLGDAPRRAADIEAGRRLLAERYSLAYVAASWRQAIAVGTAPGDIA